LKLLVNKKEKRFRGFTGIWKGLKIFLEEYPEAIHDGARVVVGVSGGKDSLVLSYIVEILRKSKNFEVEYVFVDAGFLEKEKISKFKCEFERIIGRELLILKHHEIKNAVVEALDEYNACFTCSRLRRKWLFEYCRNRAEVLMLGHHRDDVVVSLLMSMLFSARIETMLPVKPIFNATLKLVRPLYFVWEKDIRSFVKSKGWKLLDKSCNYADDTGRKYVEDVYHYMVRKEPRLFKFNLFNSIKAVKRSGILKLHPYT